MHKVIEDVVHSLLDSAERTSNELAAMRAEIGTLRADAADGELQTLREAFDALRDSGSQVGILRQQLALAERPDLVELAGELLAAGAMDFLSEEDRHV